MWTHTELTVRCLLDRYELIRGRRHYLDQQLVKIYMYQLLRAIAHMHKRNVFHRDLKPENILIENSYDVHTGLKLADFGSCRGTGAKQPHTEYISTRWYEPPSLACGAFVLVTFSHYLNIHG